MKLMICGKGGSGKSTIAAFLAKEMIKRDYRVLLVDADESNIGLYQMLGLVMPQSLLADLGGKKGFNEKLKAAKGQGLMAGPQVFKPMDLDSLPSDCTASSGNLHLVSTGKIHHFGEGCACPMGNLFRAFFSALKLGPQDLVIVDTAAGLEHFGRRLDGECDHLISVVAPSYESITMAGRMADIAQEAGLPFSVVLNNMTPEIQPAVESELKEMDVLGTLPRDQGIFMNTLKGKALDQDLDEMTGLGDAVKHLMG